VHQDVSKSHLSANKLTTSANKLDASINSSTSQKKTHKEAEHRFLILTDNNSKAYKRDLANDESHLEEIQESNTKFLAKINGQSHARHRELTRLQKSKLKDEEERIDKAKRLADRTREQNRNQHREKIKNKMGKPYFSNEK
jgi:hypothetical protein